MSREIITGGPNGLGDNSDIQYGEPLPENNGVRRGLVAAQDRLIVRRTTRGPIIFSSLLALLVDRVKGHEIYLRVLDEERKALAKEMEEKGLFGEHPLVSVQMMREPVASSSASINGSLLFGIRGEYESSSEHVSTVSFAWQTTQGRIVISEVPLKSIEILPDSQTEAPSVEFEFSADQLVFPHLSAGLAAVRRSYGHPNGYIDNALSRTTFRTNSPENLSTFLQPKIIQALPRGN